MPDPIDIGGMAPDRVIRSRGTHRLRVRYCECDPMGVAHHAAYVPWLEEARTELLRESGLSYAKIEAAGVLLVVTRLEIRYRVPARYDDRVEVLVEVSGGGRARIDHRYEVRRLTEAGEAGELCAEAGSTLACVDRSGRPRPLPDWLRPGAHG